MILVIAFALNLVFIVHNIYRYVYSLKMNQTLIVTFYALILMVTLARVVEFVTRAFDPKHGFFPNESSLIVSLEFIRSFLTIGIELTLVLTIHKLLHGLKLVSGYMNNSLIKRKDR